MYDDFSMLIEGLIVVLTWRLNSGMNNQEIPTPKKLPKKISGGVLDFSSLTKRGGFRQDVLAEAITKGKQLLLINGKKTKITPLGMSRSECARVIREGKKDRVEALAFVYAGMGNLAPFGVSSISKSAAFGGMADGDISGNRTIEKESQMIKKLQNEIWDARQSENQNDPTRIVDEIPLKIGSRVFMVHDCIKETARSSGKDSKADAVFVNVKGEPVAWLSLKDGTKATHYQQWSGTSKQNARPIAEHDEVVAFIAKIKALFPNGFPNGLALYSPITDPELKNLAVYGIDWQANRTSQGSDNVSGVLQGVVSNVRLSKTGHFYQILGGHFIDNPDNIPRSHEPVLLVRYDGSRRDHGIPGARIVIYPAGGRRMTDIDEYAATVEAK